jgi:hypothetical protein
MKNRRLVVALGLVALSCCLILFLVHHFSADGRFTFQTLMKLHDGQTYAQVVEIMGEPEGMLMWANSDRTDVNVWWGADPQFVEVRFKDGLVAQIEVNGIKPPIRGTQHPVNLTPSVRAVEPSP